ncbi:MAG: four helix bundle protein [Flavobacteriaceae bacterium]|nr:four helix bundle protein [Flavobacteriaceae bacterium]
MRTYSFEKLEVWQMSRELVKMTYIITRDFPKEEFYGLTSQVRRAAISVPSNIAEASGRKSMKDQAKFYGYSYSSLMELLNQMIIAVDLDYLEENTLNYKVRPLVEKISLPLYKLKSKG